MQKTREFNKTAKQSKVIGLAKQFIELLLEGGSRSGKTFIGIYIIFARAIQYPATKHLIVRKHFNHIKTSVWFQTIPDVIKKALPGLNYKENKSDWYIQLFNGSQIWIAGTDDKERIEKILGTEWATLYLNEISEQSYDTYELLKTRLNPPSNVKPLFLMDQNPPKKSHWSFIKFHQKLNPENKQRMPEKETDKITFFRMNPHDNIDNLHDSYIENLEGLSESKKKRFLYGEYGDDTEGALWKSDWILKNRLKEKPENIIQLVVAIDPNVTEDRKVNSNTDEAGIISVGRFRIDGAEHYVVLQDDSTPGLSWGSVAVNAYKELKADKIIGEVNQGGDLIEMNLRNYDRHISYSSVRATRGKEVRAEPVADLYRRGFVHHYGEFPDLENELTTWVPGDTRSPNRLDALVWAIIYLAKIDQGSINKVVGW
jgi:phage terminase large subunit-like protein